MPAEIELMPATPSPATSTQRRKVLLYNPHAAFFDMPLALLAIGSALDPARYQPIIIDGRMDDNAIELLAQHADEAICMGVTVITGRPIHNALEVTRAIKARFPRLPIIWGGWHTSLFAKEPLQDIPEIDVTVQGQGEATFRQLVDHFERGELLDDVQGITYRRLGEIVQNTGRALQPMEGFGRVNYDLIDVERYFQKKGRRQFDYISSTGCYFRCAFCADPFVFGRKFTAIPPEQMCEDLAYYHSKYKFTDLNFQDETFFTYAKRIKGFAEGLVKLNLGFSWAATMRADQGERLGDEVWQMLKESGLRRVLIGVESGSQEMMDWLKKDIKLTSVLWCAEKCKELGIAINFPFIVGFPGESEKSVRATVDLVRQLNAKAENFDTPIFYFKPYPGSSITDEVVKQGYRLPQHTEEWAQFDFYKSSGPWVSKEKERFFEAFKFYLKLAYGKKRRFAAPLHALAKWRVEKEVFVFPIEKYAIEKLRPKAQLT